MCSSDLIELCSETEPQIALLDIQIGGEVDGVELAEMINDEIGRASCRERV